MTLITIPIYHAKMEILICREYKGPIANSPYQMKKKGTKMIDKIETFCLQILRKIKLGKLADIYLAHKEGMRYLVFGVLTTVVNIVVAGFTYYVVFSGFAEELKVNLSTIIAIIAAWIFAYVTNKLYVFHSKTNHVRELLREIVSFTGCRLITAVVEVALMNWLVTRLQLNYMFMKIVVSIIVIILNFIFSKLLIFKKGEKNG